MSATGSDDGGRALKKTAGGDEGNSQWQHIIARGSSMTQWTVARIVASTKQTHNDANHAFEISRVIHCFALWLPLKRVDNCEGNF